MRRQEWYRSLTEDRKKESESEAKAFAKDSSRFTTDARSIVIYCLSETEIHATRFAEAISDIQTKTETPIGFCITFECIRVRPYFHLMGPSIYINAFPDRSGHQCE